MLFVAFGEVNLLIVNMEITMKSNKKIIMFSGLALFVALASINVSAQENSISQETMFEIQDRVNSMPNYQLKQRQAALLAEAQDLAMDQSATQSPAKAKSMQGRIAEINAELSMITKILLAISGAAVLDNVFGDDYKDSTSPVISLNGSNPATVELGSVYMEAGATADTGEQVVISGSVDSNSVGSYTITYTAIDDWGNVGSTTRTVNVVDTTAPVLTIAGDNPASVELGGSYSDAGATGSDLGGTVSITSSGSVDTNSVGTYTISYLGTDPSGNTATATRTVNVVDTTAPVISVTGTDPVTHELGDAYTDAGATATDLSGSITVTTNGQVNADAVGSYVLTYVATDPSGNTATATRTVNVVDTTNPVVTVTGDNPATVELGTTYTDAGATATDASGTMTVVTTGTVDADTVGEYTLTYTSTDPSGNTATATRTVNVVDTTNPVVTVTGDNPATVELGTTYTDAGATATDASGTMTVVTTGTVDADTVGEYTLTYTSTDPSGNTATATRTVNVVDTTDPVITVLGTNPATVEYGTTYTDAGATATDASGTITVTTNGEVKASVGAYTLTYVATDPSGNTATATRTVNVVDTTAPVITVLGTNPITVEYGSDYVDAGATATDLRDGTVTVVTSSTSSTTTMGEQTITYTATDAAGNTSTATRTMTVVDTAGPVITILGTNPITVEYGSDYVDAGATATDLRDGTVTVVTSSTSSSTTMGEQTITYTASDALGNTTTATRTLTVVDTTGPVITIIGENPVTLEWGDDYVDAGATATDLRDGTVTVVTSSISSQDVLGEQFVSYTATDAAGNTTTAKRIINVVDTIAPVITILGDNPASSELGSNYTDAGATALDNYDGAVTVIESSSSSENTLGAQYIFYTATDSSGNEAQVVRTVNIIDTIDPVFTSGNNFVVAENQTSIGTMTATDLDTLTFSISDVVGGDVANAIVISSGGALSFTQAPDWEDRSEVYYTATVTVSDSSGNSVSTPITVAVTDIGGFDDNPDTGTDSDTETVVIIVETVTTGVGTGTATATTAVTTTTTTP